MLKNFISFKKISHFICNFISLICSFQQCQCCECGNVSMGFWKSRVKQKSFVKSLVCDSWLNKTFVSLVISKTPYSHFLLTAFTQCRLQRFLFLWSKMVQHATKKHQEDTKHKTIRRFLSYILTTYLYIHLLIAVWILCQVCYIYNWCQDLSFRRKLRPCKSC